MTARLSVFCRGFLIVTLTAMNVGQIASRHYGGAFLCGFAISYVWWQNAHGAAHGTTTYLRECYALGAGCGTVAGILIIRALYG